MYMPVMEKGDLQWHGHSSLSDGSHGCNHDYVGIWVQPRLCRYNTYMVVVAPMTAITIGIVQVLCRGVCSYCR